jgi:Asp-tRNA(Asn)/Glu-tRNA(Gln) amidotransferase C subunit
MPRKIFGKEFREIRNDSDYNIIENIDKFINETNVKIINNHKMTLEEQLNDIMEYIKTIKQIDFESVNESITEIKNNHIKIIKLINKK